jgi:hypothetical protein
MLVVESYLVLYRRFGDQVQVSRILHGHKNISASDLA